MEAPKDISTSQSTFTFNVMQKTLKILGSGPCRNLQEGRIKIQNIIDEGIVTQHELEDIID